MPAPRVLFSFAHPDDESFTGAGLACCTHQWGGEVALVTATRGQAGRPGHPALCSQDELPARREAELRAAASILGIAHLHVLDYHDKQLNAAPPDEIRRTLVEILRRHRPHVVYTFDPNGFNLHPDHIAISRFTSDAVRAAADPRWCREAGEPHTVQRVLWTAPVAPWEAARRDDLENLAGVDFLLDITAWRDRKAAALRAHRTQHLPIDRYFFSQPDVDRLLSIEAYRQAWGPSLHRRPSAEVFEGLELD
jgi:LmbE family N-acetylglucosaminyl deacetylase